jgi:DNA-binding Lrp family transcriptional regulator
MRLSLVQQRQQYRTIYECLYETARIRVMDITAVIGGSRNTISKRLQEAFDLGYVVIPQIRKRSYKNSKEYMYFVMCDDPDDLFDMYIEDENVVYHEIIDGCANFRLISKKRIDVEGDVIIEGCRSDYHISFAPDRSWEKAVQIMQEKVKTFDPGRYDPTGIITYHWNETIEWDEKNELLFNYFKYNLRKPLSPMIKKHGISAGKAWDWLNTLPETCTIVTGFFPEAVSSYDPYIFMFETEYEDFIIDLFSELPTTCWFYRVSDKLLLQVWVKRGSMRSVDFPKPDISKLHIRRLVKNLLRRGIIKRKARASVECYWRENSVV